MYLTDSGEIIRCLGEQLLMRACSSAIFIMSRSPVLRKTKAYWKSLEDFEFLLNGGIEKVVEACDLEIDADLFKLSYISWIDKVKRKKGLRPGCGYYYSQLQASL